MDSKETYFYRLSGEIDLSAILWGLVYGTITSAILSLIYSFFIFNISHSESFFISFLYGVIVYVSYRAGEARGQNRNYLSAFLGSMAMASICFYLAWVALIFVLDKKTNYITLFLYPEQLYATTKQIIAQGKSSYTFFILEAFGYFASFFALDILRTKFFCPSCNKWLNSLRLKMGAKRFYLAVDTKFIGEMNYLALLEPMRWLESLDVNEHSEIALHMELTGCHSCDNFNILKVSYRDENFTAITVFENLIIDRKHRQWLLNRVKDLEEFRKKRLKKIRENNRAQIEAAIEAGDHSYVTGENHLLEWKRVSSDKKIVYIVTLNKDILIDISPLEETLGELLSQGAENFIVDFSHVRQVHGGHLGALILTANQDAQMYLINFPQTLIKTWDAMKWTSHPKVKFHENQEDAFNELMYSISKAKEENKDLLAMPQQDEIANKPRPLFVLLALTFVPLLFLVQQLYEFYRHYTFF